jgi:hypothetical protein
MKWVFVVLLLLGVSAALPCVKNWSPTRVTSTPHEAGHPPSNAIDNNFDPESRWAAKGEGVYITFDLGSSRDVCSVSVAWWKSATRTNNYVLSVSANNVTYTTVKSGSSLIGPETLQTYSFTKTSARYVRLTFMGNSESLWASIIEMRVTGPGFVHPGILAKQANYNFVKSKVQAGQQPWTNVFNNAKAVRMGKLTYTPSPVSTLKCASGSWSTAHPGDANNIACTRARDDAEGAWTHAVLWQLTGNIQHAQKAISILNAWANTLVNIQFNTANDPSASNGPLQAAWMAEMFIRAAELIRHGSPSSGWSTTDAVKFGNWAKSVFYGYIYKGWWGGNNWDLSMLDGLINLAVYTDNTTMFQQAVDLWKLHVPQYIYMTSDGPKPIVVYGSTNVDATWSNPTRYMNGLCQETCRDFSHTQMGLGALINTAETAYIQGENLYAYHQNRIVTSFEFHAYWLNRANPSVPADLCGGTLKLLSRHMIWEIFYNHYHNRVGLPLTNSTSVVNAVRTSGPWQSNLVAAWEVLTHCGVN